MLKTVLMSMMFLIVLGLTAWADDEMDAQLPVYKLRVQVDPSAHRIVGDARIALSDTGEHSVFVGGLKVTRVLVGGVPVNVEVKNGMFTAPAGGHIQVEYEGTFLGGDAIEDVENIGVVTEGAVGEEGISLTGLWYPTVESPAGMAYFRLTAILPDGFKAVSEGDEIAEQQVEGGTSFTFSFPHPANGITLAGGKYIESKTTAGEVDVYTYFFAEDEELAATYLQYAVKYIQMYEELIGPYPYERFSVVENFQPTGYSMPTYTLLGQRVVRLPFIVETSLGHEVLHQWFGNSVYVDYEKGNWSEGITAYLADQFYDALQGRGPEHRKSLLQKYQSYVRPENDFPLRSFFQRSDFSSAAVGYGKSAMVFHMLRGELGDDVFFKALSEFAKQQAFKRATWDDLRAAFEAVSGQELEWFFTQWVDGSGALAFQISKTRVLRLGVGYQVEFTLTQRSGPNRFRLPIYVVLENNDLVEQFFDVSKSTEHFTVTVPARPSELVLDPGYDLMRELSYDEAPPVVATLLGAEHRVAVMPATEEEREQYQPLADLLELEGFTLKEVADVKDEDLMKSSVLVMGLESPVLKRLFGYRVAEESDGSPEGFVLVALKNPFNSRLVVAGVHSSSQEEAKSAAHKIFRYSNFSILRFEGGRNVVKTRARERAGMRFDLTHRVVGVVPSKALTLDEIIANVIDKPVIYVGEGHPNYEDHKVQLHVIESMLREGRSFAVGMEMFQRPYQAPLDDYIAGKTDEKEFLRDSEYFKRWKFNYHLYREILDLCREHGIPVVALNIKAEIIKKVSREGFDALDDEERALVPPDMDMSDHAYKERLRAVFGQHGGQQASKAFENFYQAQVLWDETMAHTIAEYLDDRPDTQMLVIAGAGHLVYGSGIPKRANRLSGLDYAVLVPAVQTGTLDPDIADYVFYAEPLEAPESPLLGVLLTKEEAGLTITSVSPGSLAQQTGLRKGDVILAADDTPVEEVEDLRIELFGKQEGGTMELKIKRKRFLLGYKEMTFTVAF